MPNHQLEQFVALIAKWNLRINLTAASSPGELWEHVEDSRAVVDVLRPFGRVLDVGSGGGFPVVVAAILLPSTEFVALEPVHKKHAFLRTASRELGLSNLHPHAERIADHATRDYDAVMSRATFDLAEWLALGSQYVCPGGTVIGFEAIRRDDLPREVARTEYLITGKTRSIVRFVRDVPRETPGSVSTQGST